MLDLGAEGLGFFEDMFHRLVRDAVTAIGAIDCKDAFVSHRQHLHGSDTPAIGAGKSWMPAAMTD